MPRLEVLPSHTWPTDGFSLMGLGVRVDDLAARLGVPLEEWEEDGLGPARGAFLRGEAGLVFLLREQRHAVERLGAEGPVVEVDAGHVARVGVALVRESVLRTLRLSAADVAWAQDPSAQAEASRVAESARVWRLRREGSADA